MFSNQNQQSFGGFNAATQSSPFGQSTFGKPIATTSFGTGSTPVFGANTSLFNTKPAAPATGGLFGTATTTPTFGAIATTQSTFGANLFGSNTATPAFSQANKPTTFGFGQPAGNTLFGQPAQTTQQTTPFGQSATTTNTGLFGATTGFGTANATTAMTGTVVKFSPVNGSDSMIKNGVSQTISTRHHCITCMKEYESKSLEELRLEDYTAGRKGAVQGQTTGLFGAPAQATPFGATATSNTAATGFGGMTGFGATSQASGTGLFSKPFTGFSTPATTPGAFSFNSTTPSNLFNTQNKPFGSTAAAPLFPTAGTTPAATTGFGAINGAQPTGFGSGFGAVQPNQSIGLFNQNKPAFNMPASTATTTFGFGQTAPANTGSLFGAKPTTAVFGPTSTFGTTSTFQPTNTGFGATPAANTSLFNTSFKPAGQTTGFTFGNTPAATSTVTGTNTGLTFSNTGSSLFGTAKPGGLFGTPGTGTTFNSGGAFGTTSAFGTGGSTLPSLGMNLLGSGGLGTNQVQRNSGAVPVHQQILALVSAPFGDSPLLKNLLPASGKSEQLLKPTNPTTKSLNSPQYKVSTGNNSPRLKAKVVTAAQLSKKSMFEGLEDEDPLLEAFQPRPNAKRLVLQPKPSMCNISLVNDADKTEANKSSNGNRGDGDRLNSSINATEALNKENENQDDRRRLSTDRRSSTSWLKSTLPRKPRLQDDELHGQQSPFSISDIPEEGMNNTVTELRPQNSDLQNPLQPSKTLSLSGLTAANSSFNMDKSIADSTLHDSQSIQELDDTPLSSLQTEYQPNLAKVKLTRSGYYTIPPTSKLEEYVSGETCVVPNFTVGRKGYGNVYFPESFDVYGLDLDEIVHFRNKEVIIYPDDDTKPPVGQGLNRKAQVTLDRVWPVDKSARVSIVDPQRLAEMDYEGKLRRVSAKHDTRFLEYRPETGSWVFKVDHFSKYGLTGSDDEDAQSDPVPDPKKFQDGKTLPTKKSPGALKKLQPTAEQLKTLAPVNGSLDGKQTDLNASDIDVDDVTSFNLSRDNDYFREKQASALSPTSVHARVTGTDSHKLQLMKASFFDVSDDEMLQDAIFENKQRLLHKNKKMFKQDKSMEWPDLSMDQMPVPRSSFTLPQASFSLESKVFPKSSDFQIKEKEIAVIPAMPKFFPAPLVRPRTVVLKYKSEVVPLKQSIISKLKYHCIADAGIQMGRMFRASWGPGLTLISLSTQQQASSVPLYNEVSQLGSYISGRFLDDISSTSIVQRLQILGGCGANGDYLQNFKETVQGHLRIQLDNCILGQDGDCPIIAPATGSSSVAALHAHCTLAQELANQFESDNTMSYFSDVWRLCVSLWGNLPGSKSTDDDTAHKTFVVRREALSDWLKSVVEDNVREEIGRINEDDREMYLLLTANKLEEACDKAMKVGDYCLSLLMSQLGGTAAVRELIKQQLALWQDTDADSNISMYRLKIFMMIAGVPLMCSKQGTINVCEFLDWKRAMAVHLWYLSPPDTSITDALDLYESSFKADPTDVYAAEPRPNYFEHDYFAEVSNGKPIYDLMYHLLKLYSTGNHPLEIILNPQAHTGDPLDYRLSWLLQQVLTSIGYSHLSEYVAALTHTNFAAQLETFDLWEWAIFVVLHVKDSRTRRTAVIDLLSRHVELNHESSEDYVKREDFLQEELGIPSVWINHAKGVKACATKRWGEAAWYLIQAEEWNRAHEVIMEHLAADAVINENYDYLKSLLSMLMPAECHSAISGWAHQGQLLWDYMRVTDEIDSLSSVKDCNEIGYKLELLHPQLTLLCTKINLFPCPTAKHRLCQAEVAKRTLQLARSILMLQSDDNHANGKVLVHLVSQLPLPEDYAQQELRPIINMYVNEMVLQ